MKKKFNPDTHSVSLHFGPHIVHGHAQDTAFGEVMQSMLLREISRSTYESFSGLAVAEPAPTFEIKEQDGSSIIRAIEQWQQMLAADPEPEEFTPCSIPDWMRPSLRESGMTDAQIDSILITGVEPNLGDAPGVTFRTVTI